MFSVARHFFDRILGHHTTIVFDFDLQLVVGKDAPAKFQDFGEPARLQPMIDIAADMGLEQNRLAFSGHAAAIDEILRDMPDFGDVGMRRDLLAVRQHEAQKRFWILFERRPQIGKFHTRSIFLYRNTVKQSLDDVSGLLDARGR